MSSLHLVDPELRPILESIPPYTALDASTLPALRAQINDLARLQLETVDMSGVRMSAKIVRPADGPPVRVVIYRAMSMRGPGPGVLHIHGGGMVMGKPEMRHASLVAMARTLDCVVASVDYRLAPEAPYPAALDDCYTALQWLAANAADIGVDLLRIALAGESAGGGIAAGIALLARDRAGPRLAAQMLSYPMLDDRTTLTAGSPLAGEFVWSASANRFAWRALLGDKVGTEDVPPYAAAARAQSLAGLPPTFLGVGALDLFLDENLAFARRLIRDGVPTELHVYPGAFHAFDAAPDAAVARNFRRDWFAALAKTYAQTTADPTA